MAQRDELEDRITELTVKNATAYLRAINADLLAALKELTPNIRAIGRSDDLTPIRGEWMMKCLTRCEAAIEKAEGK